MGVGNYVVVILIPIGTTIALFFGVVIIFESFVQVEKKKKNRNQFQKSRLESSKFRKLLYFPIIRPVIIVFPMFAAIFISTYAISLIFLDNIMAFIISENVAAIISLLIANIIEKKYAKVQRY
jgi:H+/gluconate symporter-like permease